ncbi:MAG: alpha/beta hydrolase [Fuerstiella sp.]
MKHYILNAIVCSLGIVTISGSGAAATLDFPGKVSGWHGFARHDFTHDRRACIVVVPKHPAAGLPWVWRARFFGHEPQADVELLNRGFHVAYCDVAQLFGSPQAVKHWDSFYELLTAQHGFAKKPALEGMSRGGLIIYNWAAANPDKVACIYGDAPVCDFKSWPGGKGAGKRSPGAWADCLKAYGFTEAESLAWQGNPVDNLKPLAEAGIPILHVVGAADEVVPVAENSAIIEARYKALGGNIQVISKPGIGHHPHALKDPTPIVDFIVEHSRRANDNTPSFESSEN